MNVMNCLQQVSAWDGMLGSKHRGSEQILKRHCEISFMMGRHTWIVSKDDIVFVNIFSRSNNTGKGINWTMLKQLNSKRVFHRNWSDRHPVFFDAARISAARSMYPSRCCTWAGLENHTRERWREADFFPIMNLTLIYGIDAWFYFGETYMSNMVSIHYASTLVLMCIYIYTLQIVFWHAKSAWFSVEIPMAQAAKSGPATDNSVDNISPQVYWHRFVTTYCNIWKKGIHVSRNSVNITLVGFPLQLANWGDVVLGWRDGERYQSSGTGWYCR